MKKYKNREHGGYPELFFSFSVKNWNPLCKQACDKTYVRIEPRMLGLRLIYNNFSHPEIMHQIVLERSARL